MKDLLLIAIAGVMLTGVANAGMIITTNSVRVLVNNSSAGSASAETNNTTIPFNTLLNADNGVSSSKVQIDYTKSASQIVLSNGIDLSRNGGQYDDSEGYSSMFFTVDAATTYQASGYYNADDISATNGGSASLNVHLRDQTTGQWLFQSYQLSRNTVDESFVLGGTGGDTSNYNVGSLSGLLVAGHDYRFHFGTGLQANPDADDGASALGNVTLTLGGDFDTDPVPEPASIAMWSVMGGIGFMVRRKRKTA